MGNHHDSIALDWVRGEIQDTLTQGQHALEAYVDNRDDTARLRFCLNYLHQVHGTLQMVELYGAALLTEEMEKLTQAILNETVTNVDEAVDVLMQAILQLPQYLEHLGSSRDDFPMVLLPLLNDLRAARGEALLSDTSLFKPDLSPSRIRVSSKVSERLHDPKVLGHLRKLRQMYQFALAGVVREADLAAHFDYMQKVIQRLIRLCQKTPRGELWKAASAFVETLRANVNPVNTAVKSLLRELDAEIRRLTDEHADILQQPVPEALFKHLLYYVARARDLDSPQVNALRDAYQLTSALPSEDDVDAARTRVSGPGRDAIHSVVSALNEELARLKDQLDLFVRAELRQNTELDELLPGLRQVANTLAVLGLGIPRKVVTEQVELVEKLCRQAEPADDGTLMDIAGALLYVEASLAGLDSDRRTDVESGSQDDERPNMGSLELGDASEALLRESRNTLEQVKSAIVNFIASQWDTREIDHVPGLLHSIRGGLSLVPLDRVADMLASAERYVSDVLLSNKQVPDWKQLDTLADAVTSIEYYLERLAEGISDNDSILRVAEDSLAGLGFPVGQEPTWNLDQQASESTSVPTVDVQEPGDTPDAAKASDDELVDDEILGIFVEEAEEVLQTIHEFYPRLRQSHDDREALTEVRRAFHTLKGSGRLVGASSIGELAWSVENLLNRVIDQTIKPSDDLFALVDEVNSRIPSLINEFRDGHSSGDVAELIERAEALATTRRADAEEAPAPAESPEAAEASAGPETTQPDEPVTDEFAEPAATGASDSDDLIDDEILEIFIEEAGEVLDTIREYLPMLLRQHDDRTALAEVRRAYHTLKGSGRMVGAEVIGELAWSVENMLNRVIDGSIFMNDDVAQLVQDVTDAVPALVSDFEQRRPASVDTSVMQARATALANGEIPDATSMPPAEAEIGDEGQTAQDTGLEHAEPEFDAGAGEPDQDVDPVLLEIFENETETHLQTLKDYLAAAGDKTSAAYTDDLSRALHTLKGSAHTAGIGPIAEVITPLERFVKESRAQNKRADRDVLELIEQASRYLTEGLAQLRSNPQGSLEGTDEYLARLQQISQQTLLSHAMSDDEQQSEQAPTQLVQLFLGEGLDIVLDAESILDDWAQHPERTDSLATLREELEQLTRGASDAGLTDVANLAAALTRTYTAVAENQLTPGDDFFATVRQAQEQLINLMDQVAAGLATEPSDGLIEELDELASASSQASEEPSEFDQQFTEDLEEIDLSLELEELDQGAPEPAESEQPPLPELSSDDSDIDEELAEIFLEEARDLINSTADALQSWSEDTGNLDILRLLQRDLHTLKGGARLADIPSVGDLSHELENLFEGLTEQKFAVTDTLSDLLFRCHDRLAGMVDALETQELPRPAPDLIAEIHAYIDTARGSRPVTDVSLSDTVDVSEDQELPLPETDEAPEETTAEDELQATDLSHLDPELVGIFLEEAYDLINSTGSSLHAWSEDPSDREVAAVLQREVHTLKGGARMAGVDAIGDLTHVLEDLFEKVAEGQLDASGEMTDLLFACHDRLAQMVEQVATQKPCPPADELVQQVEAILRGETPAPVQTLPAAEVEEAEEPGAKDQSPETIAEAGTDVHEEPTGTLAAASEDDLIGIFLDEGLEIHEAITECLNQWREEPDELASITRLQQELHTLKGGARLSDVDPIADLAEAWSDALDTLVSGGNDQQGLLTLSDRALASLKSMLDTIEAGQKPKSASDLIADFQAAGQVSDDLAEAPEASTEADSEVVDPEVLEIFLEEAGEIMDQLEQLLDDWRKEPANHHFNQEAQRALHTLKGGARLSQLSELGDKAHAFETRLIDLGGNAPDDSQWQAITEDHDAIIGLVSAIRTRFESGAPVIAPSQTPSDSTQPEPAAEQPAEVPAPQP